MTYDLLKKVAETSFRKEPITVRVGDKVKVHIKVREKKGERIQIFEGFITKVRHGKGTEGTFTVRRMGKDGIAVEKIFRLHSDFISKVEVIKSYRVRRANLDYLRKSKGMIKLPEVRGKKYGRSVTSESVVVAEEVVEEKSESESAQSSDNSAKDELVAEDKKSEGKVVESKKDKKSPKK